MHTTVFLFLAGLAILALILWVAFRKPETTVEVTNFEVDAAPDYILPETPSATKAEAIAAVVEVLAAVETTPLIEEQPITAEHLEKAATPKKRKKKPSTGRRPGRPAKAATTPTEETKK